MKQLYDASIDIYGDAWIALSAIYLLIQLDVTSSSVRSTDTVLVSKIKPVFNNSEDPYGAQYHFWGYVFKIMAGNSSLGPRTLSIGYEIVLPLLHIRKLDIWDVRADWLGVRVGNVLQRELKNLDQHN